MKEILRWLTRVRMYMDCGMWYFPGINTIIPIVVGIIQQSVLDALLVYAGVNIFAMVLGYIDVTRLKRLQYQNEVATRWNPFLLSKLKKR